MFEKIIIALILVLAAVLVFSGCTDVASKADQLEDAVENKVDQLEDAVEDTVFGEPTAAPKAPVPSVTDTTELQAVSGVETDNAGQDDAQPIEPTPATNPAQESIDKVADILGGILIEQASGPQTSPAVPQDGLITPEEAESIALAHAGLEAGQVFIDRTECDYDNGVWHYEVEFHMGYTEYEYDIDAQTGKILSFEQDR